MFSNFYSEVTRAKREREEGSGELRTKSCSADHSRDYAHFLVRLRVFPHPPWLNAFPGELSYHFRFYLYSWSTLRSEMYADSLVVSNHD